MNSAADIANPVLELSITTPMGNKSLTFLLDSGAQCSLLDFSSVKDDGFSQNLVEKPLLSLGLNSIVRGYDISTVLYLPDSSSTLVNFFCLPSMNLTLNVAGNSSSIEKLKHIRFPLSGSVPKYVNDSIKVDGILGNDILQKFAEFELQNALTFKMLSISNGFVPIGSIQSLLAEIDKCAPCNYATLPDQLDQYLVPVKNKFNCLDENHNFDDSLPDSSGSFSDCPLPCNANVRQSKTKTKRRPKRGKVKKKDILPVPHRFASAVHFVLEPKKAYFSPFTELFEESVVEQGLDNLYSLESVGISNENTSCMMRRK